MSIRRNAAYNLVGGLLPIAVSLITVPIYLGLIGEARYGVLAIVWLLLGYFGLFDLGLGRSVAQNVAALHDAPAEERAKTFWTALAINFTLGVIGGLLIWPVAHFFFNDVVIVEAGLRPELESAVPWLMLAVPMATLSGVITGALQGRERFLELNVISVTGTLLAQTLPLGMALWHGPHLAVLLPAALGARLITVIALFACCRRHVHGDHKLSFDTARAGQLLRFGGWVTVSSVVGPLVVLFDRFAIAALYGVKSVSHYTVPYDLAGRSTLISGALVSALSPRLTTSGAEEARRLAAESLQILLIVMTPLTILAVMVVKPFLSWWITPAFAAEAGLAGQILLLGFWANALAMIPYTQLHAKGRPDLVAKYHLGELLPYFVLLYAGLTMFGLPGAAAVFASRMLLAFAVLAGLVGSLMQSFRLMAAPSALVLTAFVLTVRLDDQPSAQAALALAYAPLVAVWAWRYAPPRLRAMIFERSPLVALWKSS